MNTFLFSQKKTPSGEEQESPVRLSVEEEVISLKENAFPLISQDVLLAGVADLNPKFFWSQHDIAGHGNSKLNRVKR